MKTNESPMVERQMIDVSKKPDYSPDDEAYLSSIKRKLEIAKQQREQSYLEFGNKTYLQRYEDNKKKANTILPPKKNEEDVVIASGTLEQKLEAVLAAINGLNLSCQVRAYDKNDNKITQAGTALEDIIFQTEELDDDEEKKLMRQKELLIQGEVFVEEKWVEKFKKSKKLSGKFDGSFKGVSWETKLQKFFEGPTRTVKYGPNIYLGDITQYYMKDQPYFCEVVVEGYEQTKAIFGQWENWKFVPRAKTNISTTGDVSDATVTTQDKRWTLTDIADEQCEIITYQDRWNDEFNIIINGVMMLPAGYPLSAISPNGEYTVEKQIFKIVDAHFAYGRGFIQSSEKAAELLDEMLRLAVLKTRKSFMPPYINTSKRLISARVLQPGKITMGIPADALLPLGETSEGVTPSEFQMTKELQERIDKQTVSPQFTGQQGKSGTTATEIMELQRQAKMTMDLIVFSCSMLEKKIGYLRLWNCLENWFKPISEIVTDEGKLVNKFRKTSRETSIEGEGLGEREVVLTDQGIPDAKTIRTLERLEEEERGYPVQKIFIDPEVLKDAIKKWYIVVVPKEKDTSELQKIMFREELIDLATMMNMGSMPNMDHIEEEYSRVYKQDRGKSFQKRSGAMPMAPGMEGVDPNAAGGRPNVAGVPGKNNIKIA